MCVPDFGAGATENWGLVLYRETYLLYEDIISTPRDKWGVTSVISHELSHMVYIYKHFFFYTQLIYIAKSS